MKRQQSALIERGSTSKTFSLSEGKLPAGWVTSKCRNSVRLELSTALGFGRLARRLPKSHQAPRAHLQSFVQLPSSWFVQAQRSSARMGGCIPSARLYLLGYLPPLWHGVIILFNGCHFFKSSATERDSLFQALQQHSQIFRLSCLVLPRGHVAAWRCLASQGRTGY